LDGKILPLECLVLLATLSAVDSSEEAVMSETKFLTPEEVAERYRGGISVGTLRNWRAMRIGPSFLKIGKAILYPVSELEAWDERNRVTCRASKRLNEQTGERA
jgi:hypothetical protein